MSKYYSPRGPGPGPGSHTRGGPGPGDYRNDSRSSIPTSNHRQYQSQSQHHHHNPRAHNHNQERDESIRPSVFDRLGSKRSNPNSTTADNYGRHSSNMNMKPYSSTGSGTRNSRDRSHSRPRQGLGQPPRNSPPEEFYPVPRDRESSSNSNRRSVTPRFHKISPIPQRTSSRNCSPSPNLQFTHSRKSEYRTSGGNHGHGHVSMSKNSNGKNHRHEHQHDYNNYNSSPPPPPSLRDRHTHIHKKSHSRPYNSNSKASSPTGSRSRSSSSNSHPKSKSRTRSRSSSGESCGSGSRSGSSSGSISSDSDDSSVPSVKLRTRKPKVTKVLKNPKKSHKHKHRPKKSKPKSPTPVGTISTSPSPAGSGSLRSPRDKPRPRMLMAHAQGSSNFNTRKRRLSGDSGGGDSHKRTKRSRSFRSRSRSPSPRLRMIPAAHAHRSSISPGRRDREQRGPVDDFRMRLGHGQSPGPAPRSGGYQRQAPGPPPNSAPRERLAPARRGATGPPPPSMSMSKRPGPTPLLQFPQSKPREPPGQGHGQFSYKNPTAPPPRTTLIPKSKEALLQKYADETNTNTNFNHNVTKKSRVDQWVDQTLPVPPKTNKILTDRERPALLPTPKSTSTTTNTNTKQIPSLLGLPLISRSSLNLPVTSNPKKIASTGSGPSYSQRSSNSNVVVVAKTSSTKEKEKETLPVLPPVETEMLEENLSEISEESESAGPEVSTTTTNTSIKENPTKSPDSLKLNHRPKSIIGDPEDETEEDILETLDFEEISDEELVSDVRKIGIADALGIDWSVLVCRKKVGEGEVLGNSSAAVAAERAQIKERWTLPSIFKRIGIPKGLLGDELFGKILEKVHGMEERTGVPQGEWTTKEELINPVRRWKRLERKSAIDKYALGWATRALSSRREQTFRRYLLGLPLSPTTPSSTENLEPLNPKVFDSHSQAVAE